MTFDDYRDFYSWKRADVDYCVEIYKFTPEVVIVQSFEIDVQRALDWINLNGQGRVFSPFMSSDLFFEFKADAALFKVAYEYETPDVD